VSLTTADVLGSISRFLPLLRMDEGEIKGYAATIVEACGWMQPLHFEETCKEMLRELSPGRRPVPKQYIAVHNRLSEQLRWKSGKDNQKCEHCRGIGFSWGSYRHKETDEIITAVRPCLSCRGPSELKPELEPLVTEDGDYMMSTVKSMRPPGARWVLSMVERGKVKYPDHIIIALMEIAGKDAPVMQDKPSEFAKAVESLKVEQEEWELAE
jgi:hypothetical protein